MQLSPHGNRVSGASILVRAGFCDCAQTISSGAGSVGGNAVIGCHQFKRTCHRIIELVLGIIELFIRISLSPVS